jgi:uncharacterized membrane protein YgdD (TMEM256/DUF423 family)
MLRSQRFTKGSACIGIVASGLLFFAGDIATAIFSSSSVIALSITIGYILWMIWFVLVASNLVKNDNDGVCLAVTENNT